METKAVRKENVSLALIQPSTFNPRKTFDDAGCPSANRPTPHCGHRPLRDYLRGAKIPCVRHGRT